MADMTLIFSKIFRKSMYYGHKTLVMIGCQILNTLGPIRSNTYPFRFNGYVCV